MENVDFSAGGATLKAKGNVFSFLRSEEYSRIVCSSG
jgi:hypothetical protein